MTRLTCLLCVLVAAPCAAQRAGEQLSDPGGGAETQVPEAPASLVSDAPREERDLQDGDAAGVEIDVRLHALDFAYSTMMMGSGPNWYGLVSSVLSAGADFVLAGYFSQQGPPVNQWVAYWIILGVTPLLAGTSNLIFAPNVGAGATQFLGMPRMTPSQRLEALEFGENELNALADAALLARVLSASISIAGALISLPAFFCPVDVSHLDGFYFIFLLQPAFYLFNAIMGLASPSALEQRRDAYMQMRNALRQRGGRAQLEMPARSDFSIQYGPFGMSGTF